MIRIVLALALAPMAVWWQLAGHPTTATSVLVIGAVALAATLLAALAQPGPQDSVLICGPLLRRAVALRRKSWGAIFQRQRDPDAAGRARPRAPSAAPAAA
jgi:Family of unknown function (DUF6412)